ncbi:transposase, partial [Aureibaculum sp. A20]
KRSQKDYSLSFKLQLVEEIESGQLNRLDAHLKYGIQARSTITQWLRKYGTFDWENLSITTMTKTPEQRIIELEAKVKLLEKQKARAEHLAERADKKVIIFDMLVDMAEKEYDIQIRKNYTPELSKTSKKNTKKQ